MTDKEIFDMLFEQVKRIKVTDGKKSTYYKQQLLMLLYEAMALCDTDYTPRQ